jgi:HK97 family phage prohead protease
MNVPFQTKSFKAGPISENEVEGLASVYDNIDHAGDVVERGAYKRTLDRFNANNKGLPFLAHHKTDRPIGKIIELRDSEEGLYFKARFSNSHDGQNVREQFLDGTLDSFSIGYRTLQKQADRIGDRKVLRLKEIALHEISAVTFPCNELAKLTAVKGDIASSFPNLSLEDQQLVADFAATLEGKQNNPSDPAVRIEIDATVAIEAAQALIDEAVRIETDAKAFEDHWIAYRIRQTLGR